MTGEVLIQPHSSVDPFLVFCEMTHYVKNRGTVNYFYPKTYKYIYWAKILNDHPKNCDNVFVVQYFRMNFGTLNENTIWHQSCASVGI